VLRQQPEQLAAERGLNSADRIAEAERIVDCRRIAPWSRSAN
jgi:hypothetical protein